MRGLLSTRRSSLITGFGAGFGLLLWVLEKAGVTISPAILAGLFILAVILMAVGALAFIETHTHRITRKRWYIPINVSAVVLILLLGISAVFAFTSWGFAEPLSSEIFESLPSSVTEMRVVADAWPEQHTYRISEDIVVQFAFQDPDMDVDWEGSAFVRHIPSASEMILGSQLQEHRDRIRSEAGREAIRAVLDDETLME